MLEQLQIRSTTIQVSDDNFANGYQAGYLRFTLDFRGKPLTDAEVYSFLAKQILDIYNPSLANAGYIAGFFAAMYECRPPLKEQQARIALIEA
jgi:hypothetical protein